MAKRGACSAPTGLSGATCGASRYCAITAAEAGADYVAFGAFFPSGTKAAKHSADPEILRDWSDTTVVPMLRDWRHHP